MSQLMYQAPAIKSVDEAVQAVGQSLTNHQFGVLWGLDINEKLTKKGT